MTPWYKVWVRNILVLERLKLNYAKFGVSDLFFWKVIKEKPLGSRLDPPPLGQEGLN